MIHQIVQKIRATVACNDQKKARVTLSNKTQHLSNGEKQPAKAFIDQRLFFRLPQDHE